MSSRILGLIILAWRLVFSIVLVTTTTTTTRNSSTSAFKLPLLFGSSRSLSSCCCCHLKSSSSSNRQQEDDMEESERMEMVRRIQKSFYQTSAVANNDGNSDEDTPSPPKLDAKKNGIMTSLPLWRVGWVEVPGRANILNVHEGQYTHMFETIIRRYEQEANNNNNNTNAMYFGHLHLPGGTAASRTGKDCFALKSWRDEVADPKRLDGMERSAVVGCLMRITDYRRLQDGRLILMVQALERFVVDYVVREFPHAVAHVQLLPDIEELWGEATTAATLQARDESVGTYARGTAVHRAINHYHTYEFASTPLPLPSNTEYMQASDIVGSTLSRLLPFAQFNWDAKWDDHLEGASIQGAIPSASPEGSFVAGPPLLEDELERIGILQQVSLPNTTDARGLERLIWVELETLTRHTGFVLPQEIRCLLPPEMDYLEFPQQSPASESNKKNTCFLSPDYPASRRQARLSFSVPAIWEEPGLATAMRQALLHFTSTTARLYIVLQQLKEMNRKNDDPVSTSLGEFE